MLWGHMNMFESTPYSVRGGGRGDWGRGITIGVEPAVYYFNVSLFRHAVGTCFGRALILCMHRLSLGYWG